MAGSPFGPWTFVEQSPGGPSSARGALAGTAFDEFAQLYEECLKVSPALTPPVVAEMELWEVAAALGKARPETGRRVPARSMAEERLRAWKEGRAQPTFADRPQPLSPLVGTLIPSNLPKEGR